jgi:hypothetical protein
MTPLPHIPELAAVAKRVVWYKDSEETLRDPVLFLCHLMTHTLPEDIITVSKYVSPGQFRQALELAPPGIFDARSWAYWNVKLGRTSVPPMPERTLPG